MLTAGIDFSTTAAGTWKRTEWWSEIQRKNTVKQRQTGKKRGRSMSNFFLDVKPGYYLDRGSCLCSIRPNSCHFGRGWGIELRKLSRTGHASSEVLHSLQTRSSRVGFIVLELFFFFFFLTNSPLPMFSVLAGAPFWCHTGKLLPGPSLGSFHSLSSLPQSFRKVRQSFPLCPYTWQIQQSRQF